MEESPNPESPKSPLPLPELPVRIPGSGDSGGSTGGGLGGSRLFRLMVIANVVVWGGLFFSNWLKTGGPVYWLDARYDPKADHAKGCEKHSSRIGNVCVDQYEFPNEHGEMPKILNTPEEARAACQSAGKRLCTFDEFKVACAAPLGAGDFPPVVAAKACNLISQYSENAVAPMKSGAMRGCVNRHGLSDVIGNLAEWVEGESGPGLVGGSFGTEIGSNATCRVPRPGGPGLGEGFRGTRCCRDAPPLPPAK